MKRVIRWRKMIWKKKLDRTKKSWRLKKEKTVTREERRRELVTTTNQ